MILRGEQVSSEQDPEHVAQYGPQKTKRYSVAGGLKQYGAYVTTLEPGARTSNRHWHEEEDEMLLVLSGEATVIEDDGPHTLQAGDAACWPAGAPNAHQVFNRSDAPCTFVIIGTRVPRDVVHYPDLGRTLYIADGRWRIEDAAGKVVREGVE